MGEDLVGFRAAAAKPFLPAPIDTTTKCLPARRANLANSAKRHDSAGVVQGAMDRQSDPAAKQFRWPRMAARFNYIPDGSSPDCGPWRFCGVVQPSNRCKGE